MWVVRWVLAIGPYLRARAQEQRVKALWAAAAWQTLELKPTKKYLIVVRDPERAAEVRQALQAVLSSGTAVVQGVHVVELD